MALTIGGLLGDGGGVERKQSVDAKAFVKDVKSQAEAKAYGIQYLKMPGTTPLLMEIYQ